MSTQSTHHEIEPNLLPKHIALIMDGNGRWAKARGKNRVFGHKAGVSAVRKTVTAARHLGIQVLTLFAFSRENWRRPESEVRLLMALFVTVLEREVKQLHKNNVKFKVIGDVSRFSPSLQSKILVAEKLTANNSGLVLNVAANYGGQWDIFQAMQQIVHKVERGEIASSDLKEDDISAHLLTASLPDVDLMIRTSGEYRISNFMLWQAAYAELYFTEQLWPDFDEKSLSEAITWFVGRERRFGATNEQVKSTLAIK